MLGEILIPQKIVTLGYTLILFGLLLPLSMLLHIAEASFILLFLAFAAVIAGMLICLIGCSCYLGNDRA